MQRRNFLKVMITSLIALILPSRVDAVSAPLGEGATLTLGREFTTRWETRVMQANGEWSKWHNSRECLTGRYFESRTVLEPTDVQAWGIDWCGGRLGDDEIEVSDVKIYHQSDEGQETMIAFVGGPYKRVDGS